MERWMALDVGAKRIGVAVSDPLGITARGVEVFERTGNQKEDLRHLERLFREYGATGLLIGLPRHMDGRKGPEAEETERFGNRLGEICGVQPVYWDERLTTMQAEKTLLSADLSRRKRKKVIDQVAAVIMLESFLMFRSNRHSHNNPSSE